MDSARSMSRYDDTSALQIRFRWNPNAMRGFIASMGVLITVLVMSMCVPPPAPEIYLPRETGNTLITIVFGDGDGSGGNKGNMQHEGAKQSGKESTNPLEDASRARTSSTGKTNPSDPLNNSNVRASNDVGNRGKDNDAADERRIGDSDGREDGSGLGQAGKGSGKGLGYGDVDWGGGGNRHAIYKPLPKKPPGSMEGQVRLRFRVAPDGRVTQVIAISRSGDPSLDAAATAAMHNWKFNPLSTNVEMEGTITFTFKTS